MEVMIGRCNQCEVGEVLGKLSQADYDAGLTPTHGICNHCGGFSNPSIVIKNLNDFIKNSGLQCRTGHETDSTNHERWQSTCGETATFIICKPATPAIVKMVEFSDGYQAVTQDGNYHESHKLVIAHAQTEKDAWREAWLSYQNGDVVL